MEEAPLKDRGGCTKAVSHRFPCPPPSRRRWLACALFWPFQHVLELERGDVPVAGPLAQHLTSAVASIPIPRRPPRWIGLSGSLAGVWDLDVRRCGHRAVEVRVAEWLVVSHPTVCSWKGALHRERAVPNHEPPMQVRGEHLGGDLQAGWVWGSVHSVLETRPVVVCDGHLAGELPLTSNLGAWRTGCAALAHAGWATSVAADGIGLCLSPPAKVLAGVDRGVKHVGRPPISSCSFSENEGPWVGANVFCTPDITNR